MKQKITLQFIIAILLMAFAWWASHLHDNIVGCSKILWCAASYSIGVTLIIVGGFLVCLFIVMFIGFIISRIF